MHSSSSVLLNYTIIAIIPGWHVTQEAGKTLRGIQNVAVRPQDDYEPIQGLQHQVSELLVAQEWRLPVLFDFLGLQLQSKYLNLLFI